MTSRTTANPQQAHTKAEPICCAPITHGALGEGDAADLAGVFAALSDPVRLRLLSIVASEGEVCSCNLEGPLAKSQPTISHHTRVLAEAGLIEGEKRGRWMWWHLVPGQVERLRSLLGEADT
jgi:ArsR family transcriptional regulator